MGRRLAAQDHLPELIISSPAKRAFSTARKIARELGYDQSEIMKDESLYFSGTGGMLEFLENLDDGYQKVMIVGHNPAMTTLLNILSGSSIDNMPTCAVAVIDYPMSSWSELRSIEGQLLVYDFPKNPASSG